MENWETNRNIKKTQANGKRKEIAKDKIRRDPKQPSNPMKVVR
jgi:hypothetical protein